MTINQFIAGEGQKVQTSKDFKRLQESKTIKLEQNYRSTKTFFPLLMLLLQIIPKDWEKTLV